MDVSDPNLQVFNGRTFYLLEGKGFDEQLIALELYEWHAEPFSYALAYIHEGKLVIDDHAWTGVHASVPPEARGWFESAARELLESNQIDQSL